MDAVLTSLRNAVATGFVLAGVLFLYYLFIEGGGLGSSFWQFLFRWLHVLSGVMWIGLLWYFNFVQIPNMPNIPDDQKPAISKVIAPEALWWFRWAAMATIVTGLILSWLNGYIWDALLFGLLGYGSTLIGIGMWLGIIMFANVWLVIWPNQQVALGLIDAPAEAKPGAAKTAMQFSRINTILSIPMLFAMVAQQNPF